MKIDPAPSVPRAGSLQRPATPAQLSWLTDQVADWQVDGVITTEQASTIVGRYRATRGFSLATLVLTLGAAFVGFGLIWLVAANLDALAPVWRFAVVAGFWLAITAGAEFLATRRAHGGPIPSPVVGAVRILAALAFGAVIFQAAQSLQVPAYEPKLVGFWGLGALVYAYVVRGHGPLVVGLAATTGWYIWQVPWEDPSGLGVVLAFLVAGIVAVSVAALQERWMPDFDAPWRELGAALMLVGLFAAAIPELDDSNFGWTTSLIVGVALAGAIAAAALAFGCGRARLEPLAGLAVAGLAIVLVLWEAGNDPDNVDFASWVHAGVAIVAYVAAAAGVAVLGVLRDSWRLTALATVALVIFVTFQSFAVFGQIIQGAWLFVFLGLVFLATGYGFDRARRRLAESLEHHGASEGAGS